MRTLVALVVAAVFAMSCVAFAAEEAPSPYNYKVDEQVWSPDKEGKGKDGFWKTGLQGVYFQQKTVITPEPGAKKIKAFVNGKWQEFPITPTTKEFMQWNTGKRIEQLKALIAGGGRDLGGPHCGIVATVGLRRPDDLFSLNNAVKGVGLMPKPEKIKEILALLEETSNDPMQDKLATLIKIYSDLNNVDPTLQTSMELYPKKGLMQTKTFLNQMVNPVSSMCYMDVPTYQVKTIARLLHPADPNLTEHEKLMVKYVNTIYGYFHRPGEDRVVTIYYITELFDSSPGNPDAKGLKVSPLTNPVTGQPMDKLPSVQMKEAAEKK